MAVQTIPASSNMSRPGAERNLLSAGRKDLRALLAQPVECLVQALVCEMLAQGLMMKSVKRAFQSASVANRSAAIVTSETILAEGKDG